MTADPILAKLKLGSNHILDFEDPYTKAFIYNPNFLGSGAPIFQSSTPAGIIAYAGLQSIPVAPYQLPILYTLAGGPVDYLTGQHLQLPIAQDTGYLNLFFGPAGSQGYMGIVLGDYRAVN